MPDKDSQQSTVDFAATHPALNVTRDLDEPAAGRLYLQTGMSLSICANERVVLQSTRRALTYDAPHVKPLRDPRMKPNFLVILIDDLRYDEFGAGGHPYMKTPHIDRLAHEGAMFERAFHTTPICSPNRASIVTGQYASRHGIIDNVARDAMSHRLPNYHLELQRLGYETAHIGKWHMGNDGMPRPGYDTGSATTATGG